MSNLIAMFGMPGGMELLVVAGVAFLLFGHRLPSMMRSLGSGIVEFKKGMQYGAEDEDQAEGKAENKQA